MFDNPDWDFRTLDFDSDVRLVDQEFASIMNATRPQDPEHDVLSALDRWVEQGVAPNEIIATHYTNGVADNTRPMCPYPQFAHYLGHGPTDVASSYICR
ncbi:MAG TPA: tannase/feruloyl esterase family alpha/beta hydrolase [Stellaceae bacterium]|nr:tannase/feruloyl esterase family alpha/beta hydrolase [Stellaceae bacterium]